MKPDAGLLNIAITTFALFNVTWHEPTPEHPPPNHPEKLDPASGCAVNVTCVFSA